MSKLEWRSELPFGIAFLWGASWFFLRGEAFLLNGIPEGYGWSRYLLSAWGLQSGNHALYNAFREPLYFQMLSDGGQYWGSYVNVGIAISTISLLVLLLCVGLFARYFGGHWAGAIAMIAFPWCESTVDSVRWLNNYPLQAASFSLALVLALWACHKRTRTLLLLSSVVSGWAWSVDQRFIFFLPAVGLLWIWTLLKERNLSLSVWILLGGLIIPILSSYASVPESKRLRWSEKRVYQQDVVRRWQRFRKSTQLKEACLERPKTELLTFSFLGTRCAKETLRDNLWVVFPRHTPFGVVWTLLGLFSLLLPLGKRQWDSVVFAVGLAVPASIWLSWTHFPDRYMLLYAGPLTAMGPLSLFRLIEAVGKTETLATKIQTGGFVGVLFLVYTWEMDYCNRFATTALQQNQKEAQKRELIRVLSMHRSPEESFVDCTDSGVEAAFLPVLYHTRQERKARCSQMSKKSDSGWFWIESRTTEIEDAQNWEKFWASGRQELWLKR